MNEPPTSTWTTSRTRRLMEAIFAILVLAIFAVPMTLISICIRLTSKGNAIFVQERIGIGGRPFKLYKFRSMTTTDQHQRGPSLTKGGDRRITPLGHFIRKFKLDELPQFYNIARGDMSVVGPRPKLPQYVGIPNMPYRPGITGVASIVFRREEEILRKLAPSQLDTFYSQHIKPVKARLDICYMCHATLVSDLRVIAATIMSCIVPTYVAQMNHVESQSKVESINSPHVLVLGESSATE